MAAQSGKYLIIGISVGSYGDDMPVIEFCQTDPSDRTVFFWQTALVVMLHGVPTGVFDTRYFSLVPQFLQHFPKD